MMARQAKENTMRFDDVTLVKIALSIVDSDLFSWEKKFDIIFSEKFSQKIQRRGIEIEWCDPDCDYEDDVRAYGNGLRRWLEKSTEGGR